MAQLRKSIHQLAYIWMGTHFSLVYLEKGLKPSMRGKVTTSAKFNFQYMDVVIYAIGLPCEMHRLAAVANSYRLSPSTSIDAYSD